MQHYTAKATVSARGRLGADPRRGVFHASLCWSTKAAVLAVEYCLVRPAVDCPQNARQLGLKGKSAGARERRSVAFEVISGQEQSEPG